jgi:hypothetical protein
MTHSNAPGPAPMTKIELAREITRRSLAHIVEIERTRRGTAYRNMMKRYSAGAALEREPECWSPHGAAMRLGGENET